MANKLVYGIHDRPKGGQLLVLALQQVLAILAATIAVPTIIGNVTLTSVACALILGILTNLLVSRAKEE